MMPEAEGWYHRACAEALTTREPWVALSHMFYKQGRWADCYAAAWRALAITYREPVYTIDPESWRPAARSGKYRSLQHGFCRRGREACQKRDRACAGRRSPTRQSCGYGKVVSPMKEAEIVAEQVHLG